jgi:hypothetical protein
MWNTYHTKGITERYLYRFFTLEFLEDFLKTGDVYFPRADRFLDDMECAHISDLTLDEPKNVIEKRKKMYLISCWNLANKESFGLWNQNHGSADDKRIAAIRFKYTDLKDYFKHSMVPIYGFYYKTQFYMGKVRYFNLTGSSKEQLERTRVLYPFLRKDSAFEFEKEFRFVIEYDKVSKEAPLHYRFHLGELYQLNFDIILNPRLTELERIVPMAVIEKFNMEERLKLSDLHNRIKQ